MAKEKEEKNIQAEGGANADKLKALRAAMDKIEKSYGKGSIMKLGDEKIESVEIIDRKSVV